MRPTPRPEFPRGVDYDSAEMEAYRVATEAWLAAKKQHAGLYFAYGRYGQFTFVWEDQKGPDGRFLCRGCAQPVTTKRRRYYCGDKCDRDFWRLMLAPTRWSTWRSRAIHRDGARCVLCGADGKSPFGDYWLEVDHIKPVARHPLLEFDLSNLRTMCHACHARFGARPPKRMTSKNHSLVDA